MSESFLGAALGGLMGALLAALVAIGILSPAQKSREKETERPLQMVVFPSGSVVIAGGSGIVFFSGLDTLIRVDVIRQRTDKHGVSATLTLTMPDTTVVMRFRVHGDGEE